MGKLAKGDVVIILGDFGLVWSNPMTNEEKYWLDWLENKPVTTLFVDSNHENFNLLNSYSMDMLPISIIKLFCSKYTGRGTFI